MSFFTSDQHWNNLVEENKKTPFIEESDFALINIIPGKFPQYGGDCPRLLRQVAYVNIPNICSSFSSFHAICAKIRKVQNTPHFPYII